MKECIKLFFSGLLLIWLSFISVVFIVASITTFIVTLPASTGFVAVCAFIWGCFCLAAGVVLVCVLGVFHNKAVDNF